MEQPRLGASEGSISDVVIVPGVQTEPSHTGGAPSSSAPTDTAASAGSAAVAQPGPPPSQQPALDDVKRTDASNQSFLGSSEDVLDVGDAPTQPRWVINPTGTFRVLWDVFVMIFVIINVLTIPYKIAFIDSVPLDGLFFLDVVMDIYFVCDIGLNFRTGYIDNHGEVIFGLLAIAKNYLTGFFLIDIMSVMPIDYILLIVYGQSSRQFKDSRIPRITRLVRLVRLLRLPRLFRYLGRHESKLRLDATTLWVLKGAFMLGLFVHWNACLYYLTSSVGGFDERSWTRIDQLQYVDNFSRYTYSLLAATSMMVGCGWGTFNSGGPTLVAEQWVVIYIMFCGANAWAGMVGLVTAINLSGQARTETMENHVEKTATVMKYMEACEMPPPLRRRMEKVLKRQSAQRDYDEDDLFGLLPTCVQRSLNIYAAKDVLETVPLFADRSQGVLAAVASMLKQVSVMKGDKIIAEGEPASVLYFIGSGVVAVFYDHTSLVRYEKGSFFGEVPMLWPVKQPVTFMAASDCDFYTLDKDALDTLLAMYPDMDTLLRFVAKKRLSAWGISGWIDGDASEGARGLRNTSSLHYVDDVLERVISQRAQSGVFASTLPNTGVISPTSDVGAPLL